MDRQPKRRQPGVGFTHKNSEDLLPLDMRVGTSKDAQPHVLVQKKQVEGDLHRLDISGNKGGQFTSIKETTAEQVIKSKHLPLMVKCQCNKEEFEALIDTGSRYTIVSSKRAGKCGLVESSNHSDVGMATAFPDARWKVKGQIEGAEINLGGCLIHCDLLVTDDDNMELLIGLDTLRISKAIVDLDRQVLIIGQQEIRLMSEKEIPDKYQ
ncbi:nuclear receptor-interacting protein 3-like [Glandiceps talaboti]